MTCEDVIVGILVVTRRPMDDTPEGTLGRITQVRFDPWGFTVLWDWALHRDRYPHSLWLDSAKLAAFERVTDEEAEAIRTRTYEEKYLSWRSPQLVLPFDPTWGGPQANQRHPSNPMRFGGGRW